jgi:hypothetical protein
VANRLVVFNVKTFSMVESIGSSLGMVSRFGIYNHKLS